MRKLNKRGMEINQHIIITVLSMILLVLLIIFMFKACKAIKDKERSIIVADLEQGVRGVVDLLLPKDGSIVHRQFLLPPGTDTVCFVDTSHKDVIMHNTTLTREYPLINNSLASNSTDNMFLIKNMVVTDALYAGNICFDYFPFYACVAAHDNILDVWFEGKGGCTTLYINWSIFPINYRNFSYYRNNPLFLVEEKTALDNNVFNWREISTVVPLSLFRENNTRYFYNYSSFYVPLRHTLSNLMVWNLMNNYSANMTYLFDNNQTINGNPNHLVIFKSVSIPSDYLGFWSNYSSFIVVDYNNRYAAVIASLLAGYVNTPLVFIDHSNNQLYKDLFRGKQIFIVTHENSITLDSSLLSLIQNYASRYQMITDSLLQSEGRVSTFAKLNSTIFIT